jgi:hypothetical protein
MFRQSRAWLYFVSLVSVWLRVPAIAFFPADLLKFMMNLSNQRNVNGIPFMILQVEGCGGVHARTSEGKVFRVITVSVITGYFFRDWAIVRLSDAHIV